MRAEQMDMHTDTLTANLSFPCNQRLICQRWGKVVVFPWGDCRRRIVLFSRGQTSKRHIISHCRQCIKLKSRKNLPILKYNIRHIKLYVRLKRILEINKETIFRKRYHFGNQLWINETHKWNRRLIEWSEKGRKSI